MKQLSVFYYHAVCINILILLSLLTSCASGPEVVPYGTGSWDNEELGNHRAVIRVVKKADAARVHIPWRRRDHNPEKKNIIVIDSKTGERIINVLRIDVNREFGDILFQPSRYSMAAFRVNVDWGE